MGRNGRNKEKFFLAAAEATKTNNESRVKEEYPAKYRSNDNKVSFHRNLSVIETQDTFHSFYSPVKLDIL